MLVMDGAAPVAARTMDVGSGGVSVTVADPLNVGQKGRITFEIYIEGKSHMITAQVAVAHCILSHDGFKAGFQFFNLDPAVGASIAKYMR